MKEEIISVPDIVSNQLDRGFAIYRNVGSTLREERPNCLITCARGSSDYATLYLKYLVETQLGIPVCSMGPSISSVYRTPLKLSHMAMIAVSQSGGSRDLVALMEGACAGGATAYALVNNQTSDLAEVATNVLPMMAGPEKAVAATKSYICSLVALASIVAEWSGNRDLETAIRSLPADLDAALAKDWRHAAGSIPQREGVFIVARGPALAIACEAALKFKETCGVQAEAFSAAEVRHGPIALAGEGLTAIALSSRDEAAQSVHEAIAIMRKTGARTLVVEPGEKSMDRLPTQLAGHPLLDPICQILSFYRFVEYLSVHRGYDPDAPAQLQKVTVTL